MFLSVILLNFSNDQWRFQKHKNWKIFNWNLKVDVVLLSYNTLCRIHVLWKCYLSKFHFCLRNEESWMLEVVVFYFLWLFYVRFQGQYVTSNKAVVNLQEAASKSCQLDTLHGEVVLVYFLRFRINNLRWQHLHVNDKSVLTSRLLSRHWDTNKLHVAKITLGLWLIAQWLARKKTCVFLNIELK